MIRYYMNIKNYSKNHQAEQEFPYRLENSAILKFGV